MVIFCDITYILNFKLVWLNGERHQELTHEARIVILDAFFYVNFD